MGGGLFSFRGARVRELGREAGGAPVSDVIVFCGFVWTLCSTPFLSLLDVMEKTFTLEAVYW